MDVPVGMEFPKGTKLVYIPGVGIQRLCAVMHEGEQLVVPVFGMVADGTPLEWGLGPHSVSLDTTVRSNR